MQQTSVANIGAVAHGQYLRLSLTPTGVPASHDNNPIARLNFSVKIYNYDYNCMKGVQLLGVFTLCPISWVYDKLIYFYQLFFLTITCQSEVQRGFLVTLLLLAIYVALLIAPIISAITLAVSGFFFVYYCIGVVVYCINNSRLNGHAYTERMVPASKAPEFQGANEFFEINAEYVKGYYYSTSNVQFYLGLAQSGRTTFMAYKQRFLDDTVNYIVSPKVIIFHITFMLFAIIGLVISVKAFPSAYPGTK